MPRGYVQQVRIFKAIMEMQAAIVERRVKRL